MLNLLSWMVSSPLLSLAHTLTRLTLVGLAVSAALAVLCVLALPAVPLARRLSATLRFRLLAVAFLLAAFLPLFAMFWHRSPRTNHTVASTSSVPLIHLGSGAALLVASLWIALSLVCALRLCAQSLRLRWVLRGAQPLPADFAQLENLPCSVALSDHVDSPCLVGVLRPVILIPRRLLKQLTARQLAVVLAHELAHLRRLDPAINLLQKLALVVFPLHPVLHLLDRCLCRERELACDELVLRRQHAPADYAASLVDVAAFTLNQPTISLPFGLMRSSSELSARIEHILRPLPRLHPALTAILTFALTAGAGALTGVAFHYLPTIAFASVPSAPVASRAGAPIATPTNAMSLSQRPARMVPADYRALPPSARAHHPSAIFAARRVESPYTRAITAAWYRPHNHHSAPRLAALPATASVQPTPNEYSFVFLLTSVTATTEESPQSLPSSDMAQTSQPAQTHAGSARIYFSIVTTTLRLTAAQRARISPEWLAHQL